jgi:hypothetical protein
MHRSALVIAAAAVLGATPAAATGPTRVPPAFLGAWSFSLAACGNPLDDSRLIIRPNRTDYFESSGVIQSVTVHSPREISITARMSGEGEVWTDTTRLRLPADGKELAEVTEGEAKPFIRRRCPK